MDPFIRKTAKILQMHHSVNRWLEYAVLMGFLAVVSLGLDKWQGWPLIPLVTIFVVVAVLCTGVAGHFTIQVLALETHLRRIERSRAARRRT